MAIESKSVSYSFVIPHRNSPNELKRCLDSIPYRDDVQTIVVDDNSDPDVVAVIRDYESMFPNSYFIFSDKKGGAGFARNIGLEKAIGKWVVFADADDYFHPCINDALDHYSDSSVDIVFFKGDSIDTEAGRPAHRADHLNAAFDKADETGDFSDLLLYTAVYMKFIQRDLILANGINFNETPWANDVVFCAKIANAASTYALSPLCVYCLTKSSNSLTCNMSSESQMVRLNENLTASEIYSKLVPADVIAFHLYQRWKMLYKVNKVKAITVLPKTIRCCGWSFIKELFRIQ